MKLPSFAFSKLAVALAHLQQLCDPTVFEVQTDQLSMFDPPTSGPWTRCSDRESWVIDTALTQFRLIGRATKNWYEANPEIFERAPQSVRRWFGDLALATPANRDANRQMITRLAEIAISNGGFPPGETPVRQPFFECGPDIGNCVDNRAWTLAAANIVNICPAFFSGQNTKLSSILPDGGDPTLPLSAGTIAHECTHSRILMTLGDSNNVNSAGHNEIYGYDECLKLAAKDPNKAILNADNYKWYTQESYIEYCCSDMDTVGGEPTPGKEGICGALWAEMKNRKCGIM